MKKYRSSRLPLHHLLLAAALTITPFAAEADDDGTTYYSDIATGNWELQTWSPSTVPGTTDGSPSTDRVTIDKTGSGAGELRLAGSRTVGSFSRFRAVGSAGGSIRLVNSGNTSVKLTIQDLFSVESGYLYLRAHHSYLSARLAIEADRMEIGSTEWNGGVPESGSIGTVYFSGHSGTNDYSRVSLKVNSALAIIGNGRFVFDGTATGDAEIDLGDVVFRDNVANGSPLTPVFALGSASSAEVDHRVKIRSLRSDAENSSGVTVTGGATVELYGDAPSEPEHYRFYGEIKETTRLEKVGSNTQVLAKSDGHSYSGGTLISGGTLLVENTTGSGLGSGSVTVEGSGTLGGGGRIALASEEVINVKAGGTLAPGKEGDRFNTLHIITPTASTKPALSMESGSRFSFTVGADNASDTIELLNYTDGALALAPGGIEVILHGELAEGVYHLFVFREGGEGSALVSSGFTEGLFVTSPSNQYNITLHYNDAAYGGPGVIAMEVTAIPEPSTVAFLAAGVGFLGFGMARQACKLH